MKVNIDWHVYLTTLSLMTFVSYVMWQSAVMIIVACHYLAVRTLWRMIGAGSKLGATGIWACIGLLITAAGRATWQIRNEPEVISQHSLGTVSELLFWSVAAFLLSILLARELRRLLGRLQIDQRGSQWMPGRT